MTRGEGVAYAVEGATEEKEGREGCTSMVVSLLLFIARVAALVATYALSSNKFFNEKQNEREGRRQ